MKQNKTPAFHNYHHMKDIDELLFFPLKNMLKNANKGRNQLEKIELGEAP